MAAYKCVRLDHRHSIANVREHPIETNEYHSVDGAEREFLWSSSPQNVDLLPQRPNLCLKHYPRPDQIDNHPTNEPAKIPHCARSSSDSRSTAKQDKVCDRDSRCGPLYAPHLRRLSRERTSLDRRPQNRKAADAFAANVLPIVGQIQAASATTHRAIARALNDRGVRTTRGGDWHDSTVRNLGASALIRWIARFCPCRCPPIKAAIAVAAGPVPGPLFRP